MLVNVKMNPRLREDDLFRGGQVPRALVTGHCSPVTGHFFLFFFFGLPGRVLP